jgi:hypothetical protein
MLPGLANVHKRIAELEESYASEATAAFGSAVEFAHSSGFDELDGWQADLLSSEAPRVLLNISRQAGKSSMSGVLAVHKALTTPGALVLILAPSERQAKETFTKAASLYKHDIPADSYRKLGMQLRNGSRIEALPGSERTVRGYSGVDLLILDEAARVEDALYHAVRPMLAVSGGRLVMMSTPFGKRGVFFETWERGEGWERYLVPATDCPRIPAEFLEEERRSLPAWVFEQEYMCQFADSEAAVFTDEDIRGALVDDFEPLFRGGITP